MTAPETPFWLTDDDLYLFGEGTWLRAYEKLGAHPRTVDGVAGVNFAVWAPGAERVAVELYGYTGVERRIPMALRGPIGVWEAFVPGLAPGAVYKYAITSKYAGYQVEKADPYAFHAEHKPATASIVYDLAGYTWGDAQWMAARAAVDQLRRPIAIYELHLGSWRLDPQGKFLNYREIAHQLVPHLLAHGFTHVELLPVAEHPYDKSWGYQITGYFAPTSRFGTPHDFMYFVDYCHRHGIGVLMDWVPGHFVKDRHGLYFFDGTHVYEHADPRLGEHLEWGTGIFNYGRNEVVNFLLANAHYWLGEYHLDGMRIDAVSSMLYLDYERPDGAWLPNRYGGRENLEAIDFLRRVNDVMHREHPGILTCAEEATAWPGVTRPAAEGGLGFDLKWNMGWMNDTLRYLERDPLARPAHQSEITFSYTYAFAERYILPLSHDEVVHLKHSLVNKPPGEGWQRFATLRALYAMMWAHPGKKLLFMGGEFAQLREWADTEALEWHLLQGPWAKPHLETLAFVTELNHLYRSVPALGELDLSWEGFAWIDGRDHEHSVVAILRKGSGPRDLAAVVCNWQPIPRADYRVGVPLPGRWEELLNTDETRWGGFGIRNDAVEAEAMGLSGYPYSVRLKLPPLSVLWLAPAREAGERTPAGG